MIYYKNHNNYIRNDGKTYELSKFQGLDEEANERSLPIKYVKDMIGLKAQNGILKNGTNIRLFKSEDGEDYAPCPHRIDNIYCFKKKGYREIIASCEGRAYTLNETTKSWELVPNTYFSGGNSLMFPVENVPCLLIPKDDFDIHCYNGVGFFRLKIKYSIKCMTAHMNRLFIVDKNNDDVLLFSGVDLKGNFSVGINEGGSIHMDMADGGILSLLSYNGNLYIFMEHAIYRLTAFADQRNFLLRKVMSFSEKLREDSIVLCDNGFIFMTNSKTYFFDGNNIRRILREIDKSIGKLKGKLSSIYMNGIYYLASLDGEQSRLYECNIQDDTICVYNVQVRKLGMISHDDTSHVFVLLEGDNNVYFIDDIGTPLIGQNVRYWNAENIDFGLYDKKKEIVNIAYDPLDRYDLYITCDGKTYCYHHDSDKRSEKVKISGYKFSFKIVAKGDVVHSPTIKVRVVNGKY